MKLADANRKITCDRVNHLEDTVANLRDALDHYKQKAKAAKARVAELEAEDAKLRRALEFIANHPHCTPNYNLPHYLARVHDPRPDVLDEHDRTYQLGVVDGHRCAAQTARDALKAMREVRDA